MEWTFSGLEDAIPGPDGNAAAAVCYCVSILMSLKNRKLVCRVGSSVLLKWWFFSSKVAKGDVPAKSCFLTIR